MSAIRGLKKILRLSTRLFAAAAGIHTEHTERDLGRGGWVLLLFVFIWCPLVPTSAPSPDLWLCPSGAGRMAARGRHENADGIL
jgi:hypothetical protein